MYEIIFIFMVQEFQSTLYYLRNNIYTIFYLKRREDKICFFYFLFSSKSMSSSYRLIETYVCVVQNN